MKKLLIAALLITTSAYAKPNYSGTYTGTLSYQTNETSGHVLAKEGDKFQVSVSHYKRKIYVTDLSHFDYQGQKFTKIPGGFEWNDTWRVNEGTFESYCTAQQIIRITKITKKTAELFYLNNADCTDGTFIHSEATVPLERKMRRK